jgi:hypothetical protein
MPEGETMARQIEEAITTCLISSYVFEEDPALSGNLMKCSIPDA